MSKTLNEDDVLKEIDRWIGYLDEDMITRIKIGIKKLPSAQPEQRWIPVSEGLPKEYGEYICTMENGQVQECGFVPENQRGLVDGWSTCEADGHKSLGYADVLAWMPLPEPWEEGADE